MTRPRTPVLPHLVWQMGHQGHMEQIWWRRRRNSWCMWIRAVDDSRWARGRRIPLSPTRRRAWSGWRARGKVERELDSLLVVP